MGVSLRQKENNDGTTSLYLDIYHNGKRKYEFLQQLKILTKPKNTKERASNKEKMELARNIVSKRQLELESIDFDITPKFKQNIDFIEYFNNFISNYRKRDKRVIEATFNKFKSYLKEAEIRSLSVKQLDESIVHEFKNYLSENLKGESPANYFKKFKLVIKQAVRQKIMTSNPAQDVSIKAKQSIKKQILTPDEIQQLAATPITNEEVKRAFIFSLYTGLRFSDIINLKWQNIDLKNKSLNIVQEKTKEQVNLNLHTTALKILGEPQTPKAYVFTLPSHTACTKDLKYWVKKAGINKSITWHCARHTFATNIIFFGADVNTASKLLGHTSFRYTERYTHVVKALKEKAINNLPEANF
jgi:integrase/recombinase XerD